MSSKIQKSLGITKFSDDEKATLRVIYSHLNTAINMGKEMKLAGPYQQLEDWVQRMKSEIKGQADDQ